MFTGHAWCLIDYTDVVTNGGRKPDESPTAGKKKKENECGDTLEHHHPLLHSRGRDGR
jgi:hypothetical protein